MQMEHGWNLLQHVCVLKGRSLDPYHTFPRVFPHAPRPKIFKYIPKVTKEVLSRQGKPGGFSHVGKTDGNVAVLVVAIWHLTPALPCPKTLASVGGT